jgi:transposase
VLREKLGKKRIILSDDQRQRLAIKGKLLGRKMLREVAAIVGPDTILRWHRQLVAQKWDHSDRRRAVGRLRISEEIGELVLQIARENARWGYGRIQCAMNNLGYKISDTTIGNILREHGMKPSPKRKTHTTWHEFLKSHCDVLAAIDFTTIEVWTKNGLATFYLLFVMTQATRKVKFAGCTTNPNEAWMQQIVASRHRDRRLYIKYFGGGVLVMVRGDPAGAHTLQEARVNGLLTVHSHGYRNIATYSITRTHMQRYIAVAHAPILAPAGMIFHPMSCRISKLTQGFSTYFNES